MKNLSKEIEKHHENIILEMNINKEDLPMYIQERIKGWNLLFKKLVKNPADEKLAKSILRQSLEIADKIQNILEGEKLDDITEIDIKDLIPFLATDEPIWVDINDEEWVVGNVVGLDLVSKRVRVAFASYQTEDERMYYSKWFDLYFQLNKNFKKRFFIKIK